MRRIHDKSFLLIAALAAAFASSAHSQSQCSDEQDEPLKLSTELAVVDAQALTKKGGSPVTELMPLSIVLLLDVSGSVMPVINKGTMRSCEVMPEIFGAWSQTLLFV